MAIAGLHKTKWMIPDTERTGKMYRIRDHRQLTNSSPTWGDGDWEEVNNSPKRLIIIKLRDLEIGPNLRHNICVKDMC